MNRSSAPAARRAPARDLADRQDVEVLVRTFYGRAFEDPLLGPVFVDIAHLDLDAHLPVMCDFWETVLFRAGRYRRNAFEVHARLHARSSLTSAHFRRWLELWTSTTDDLYVGPRAETAKIQAGRIAWAISRRLLGTTDDALLVGGPRREQAPERSPGGGR
jgi:hemoglobin